LIDKLRKTESGRNLIQKMVIDGTKNIDFNRLDFTRDIEIIITNYISDNIKDYIREHRNNQMDILDI